MATIQGIYVALFGRPADPAGLAFFNEATNEGADLTAIGDLAATEEYQDRFDGMNNAQIVRSIYQSLFNRDPEAAGLEFFVDALNNGTLTINNIAIAILDGATGTDKDIVEAKIASADLYTAAIDTALEVGSYVGNTAAAAGRAFLTDVGTTAKTPAQADTAVAEMVAAGQAGNTITLTAATDILSPTSKVGDVTATSDNDTINSTGTNWDPAADTIDAGFGVDTFNLTDAGDAAVATDGLKNVEIFNIGAAAAGAKIDVAEAKELTQVWNNASAGALEVENVALATTVGLKGNLAALTTKFAFAGATGTADAASLAISGATSTGAVTIADIETLNISNSGTSKVTGLDAAAAKTVTVTGSGSLELGFGSTVVESLDANAFAGKLNVNLGNQANLKSVVTGSGSDSIKVDTNSTNAVTVDAGAGADTITVVAAGAATKAITLTGGADADIFVLGEGGTALNNASTASLTALNNSLVTITDFGTGADAIKVEGTTRDVLLDAELESIAGEADLLAAATKAATYMDTGDVAVFNYGGDAYILVSADAAFGAGDGLIKVTGASVADFDATNFQIV